MDKNKLKIIKKYFNYRLKNSNKDETIDNIFLNEIYWPDNNGNDVYLFEDFEKIENFFKIEVNKKCVDIVPKRLGEDGEDIVCGTMWRNASICDDINEAIFTRIYEELEKRSFNFKD